MDHLTVSPPTAAAAPTPPAPTAATTALDQTPPVPPPRRTRRRRQAPASLQLHAVQVLSLVGLLPLAATIVGWATVGRRGCPVLAPALRRGRPRVYDDASVLVLALLGRLWHLSTRELCGWLERWPTLAVACGLPPGRVPHPAHLSRRIARLGTYPFWLL